MALPPPPPGSVALPPPPPGSTPLGGSSSDPPGRNPNAPDPVGFVAGLGQGVADIPEAAGQMIQKGGEAMGVDPSRLVPGFVQRGADALRQRAGASNAGKAGEMIGSIAPFLFQPELGIGAAARAAPYVGRGLEWLWNVVRSGTLPAALQPTSKQAAGDQKDFWKEKGLQAGIGTAISTAASLPGVAARSLGYRDVPQLLRAMERHSPQFVQKTFDAMRQFSMPGFNKAWYDHVLEPLGLKRPNEVGHEGMGKLSDIIGKELDDSTVGMTLDARAGTPASTALNRTAQIARDNLMSTGNAATAFSRIINETVNRPMAFNMGRLTSDQLKQVASNLKSRIDSIAPFSPENRALKHELENFRQEIFDQANGGDKTRYQAARESWRRFAIGREATPPTEQMFTPSGILTQMDRRSPFQVPLGRAKGQGVAQAGHEALLMPGQAASRAQQGLPPRSIPSVTPGVAAFGGSKIPEIIVRPKPEQRRQEQ